ncbi:MAG TPA: YceI family protein [Bryobacteraceae bacterium]|nr:YceI family protein [Bryobacteraceae bacterium]
MSYTRNALILLLAAAALDAASVRFEMLRDKSIIAVRTGKAGVLSAFGAGHAHGITATDFAARLCADPQTLAGGSVSVRVPARALRIDSAAARRAAGLTASGPDAADVPVIQQKMLSPANLAADEHPVILFESTSVQRTSDTLVVRGPLTIRGRSNSVSIPLRIERAGNGYRFAGKFPLRLTEYGIKPESVGGVVKVANEVTVIVELLAVPTQESCK